MSEPASGEGTSRELAAAEAIARAADELRGQVCGVARNYANWRAEWASCEDSANAVEAKEFQARHAALKAALGHLDLLLKVMHAAEGGAAAPAAEESEEDLEAEAVRNLARPA